MSIENLKTFDPFAEADEDTGETKQSQNYIHIRIQRTSFFSLHYYLESHLSRLTASTRD
jgi:hypothetical protein